MKLYAVALVRAALPLLRHRLAKVRIAGVQGVRALVKIPNRDKRKGAGEKGSEGAEHLPLQSFAHSNIEEINSPAPFPPHRYRGNHGPGWFP